MSRRVALLAVLALFASGIASCATTPAVRRAPPSWPAADWARASPEAEGMSSARLADAIDAAIDQDLLLHSVTVVRSGRLVLSAYFHPFAAGSVHDVASCTKSVLSTLVGIARDRGELPPLDTPIVSLFPDRVPANLDAHKQAMTLSDLLTMRSGLDCLSPEGSDLPRVLGMLGSPDWAAYALDIPMATQPGTRFAYCSPGSHLVATALARSTRTPLLDFAQAHLFGPIGIASAVWPTDPAGVAHGWGDLAMTPEDLARFGYLVLRGGAWNGRRVVSEAWLREATRAASPIRGMDPIDGYGLHWWVSEASRLVVALGRGGQIVAIVPDLDLVVVLTGQGERNDALGRKARWIQGHLLPAVRGDAGLPRDAAGEARLEKAIARAASDRSGPPRPPPPLPEAVRAALGTTWRMDDNPVGIGSIRLQAPSPAEVRVRVERTWTDPIELVAGLDGTWRTFPGTGGRPARSRGEFDGDGTLVIDFDEIGGINRWTLRLRLDGDAVRLGMEDASGNPPLALTGHAAQ